MNACVRAAASVQRLLEQAWATVIGSGRCCWHLKVLPSVLKTLCPWLSSTSGPYSSSQCRSSHSDECVRLLSSLSAAPGRWPAAAHRHRARAAEGLPHHHPGRGHQCAGHRERAAGAAGGAEAGQGAHGAGHRTQVRAGGRAADVGLSVVCFGCWAQGTCRLPAALVACRAVQGLAGVLQQLRWRDPGMCCRSAIGSGQQRLMLLLPAFSACLLCPQSNLLKLTLVPRLPAG